MGFKKHCKGSDQSVRPLNLEDASSPFPHFKRLWLRGNFVVWATAPSPATGQHSDIDDDRPTDLRKEGRADGMDGRTDRRRDGQMWADRRTDRRTEGRTMFRSRPGFDESLECHNDTATGCNFCLRWLTACHCDVECDSVQGGRGSVWLGYGYPRGPDIEKIQDRPWGLRFSSIEISSEPPTKPFLFVCGELWRSGLNISTEIDNFQRYLIFSIFGP